MVKYFIAFVVTLTLAFAQISTFIPGERTVDWTTAGLASPPPPIAREYTVATAQELLDSLEAKDPAVMTLIHLNAGEYNFNQTLRLQPNTILKGQGSDQTTLVLSIRLAAMWPPAEKICLYMRGGSYFRAVYQP
jgi:hypothetical protein